MFNQKVGAYIAILRKAGKYTQQGLAEKLGVSHQAVSNWERGESMPDISLLPKLAAVLGTTTDNILSADRDDFRGFDEIIENVNIIKQKKRNNDAEILTYLNSVAGKLNEIIVNYANSNNSNNSNNENSE